MHKELAACYRMFAHRGMDDPIYRICRPASRGARAASCSFPSACCSRSDRLEPDRGRLDGNDLSVQARRSTPAGSVVPHGLRGAPEAQCVMHLHTICGTAVSAQQAGLLPVNQLASPTPARSATTTTTGPGLRPEEQRSHRRPRRQRDVPAQARHPGLGSQHRRGLHAVRYLERTCEIQVAAQGGAGAGAAAAGLIDATVHRAGRRRRELRPHRLLGAVAAARPRGPELPRLSGALQPSDCSAAPPPVR